MLILNIRMSGYGTSLVRLNHLRLADDRALEEEAERYNPVNPVRNPVISGGFATPSFGTSKFVGGRVVGGSIARDVRLAKANNRATEEETMRTNPLRKGATPTMGVSQVRGGRKSKKSCEGGATLNELAKFGSDELKVHKEAHQLMGGAVSLEKLTHWAETDKKDIKTYLSDAFTEEGGVGKLEEKLEVGFLDELIDDVVRNEVERLYNLRSNGLLVLNNDAWAKYWINDLIPKATRDAVRRLYNKGVPDDIIDRMIRNIDRIKWTKVKRTEAPVVDYKAKGKLRRGGKTAKEIADEQKKLDAEAKAKKNKKDAEDKAKVDYANERQKERNAKEEEYQRKYREAKTLEEREDLDLERRNEFLREPQQVRKRNAEAYVGMEPETLEKNIRQFMDGVGGREPTPAELTRIKKNTVEGRMKQYGKPCPMTYERALKQFEILNGRPAYGGEITILKNRYREKTPEDEAQRQRELERQDKNVEALGKQGPGATAYGNITQDDINKRKYKEYIEEVERNKSDIEKWFDKNGHYFKDVIDRIPIVGPLLNDTVRFGENVADHFQRGQYLEAFDDVVDMGKKIGEVYTKFPKTKAPTAPTAPTAPARERPNYNEDLGDYEVFNFEGDGRKRMNHHAEAKEMGRALSLHLKKLHGGAYASAFATGMSDRFSDELKPELAGKGKTGAYEGLGTKKGMVRKTARKAYEKDSDSDMEGAGFSQDQRASMELSTAPNPGNLEAPPVPAIVGGRRAPSKRNEIVKKVMREKGLSMIKASSYVKEHNLYKP
jgi:hypothetical protein